MTNLCSRLSIYVCWRTVANFRKYGRRFRRADHGEQRGDILVSLRYILFFAKDEFVRVADRLRRLAGVFQLFGPTLNYNEKGETPIRLFYNLHPLNDYWPDMKGALFESGIKFRFYVTLPFYSILDSPHFGPWRVVERVILDVLDQEHKRTYVDCQSTCGRDAEPLNTNDSSVGHRCGSFTFLREFSIWSRSLASPATTVRLLRRSRECKHDFFRKALSWLRGPRNANAELGRDFVR
jgi:hypothetical protein